MKEIKNKTEKKNFRTQTKLDVKDRGDSRKDNTTKIIKTVKINTFGLGDTEQKITQKITSNYREDKSKQALIKKDEINKQEVFERLAVPKKVTDKFENQIRTYLDLEGRKRLRERYTVKLNKQSNLIKNEAKPEKILESDKEENKPGNQKEEEIIHTQVKSEVKIEKLKDPTPPKRKPIIKTIRVKNESRVYKAVTFVDNTTHIPLQIKLPNTKRKPSKSTVVNFPLKTKEPSKLSIKEKPVRKEKLHRNPRVSSPEFLVKRSFSPPTEVAKWAPSCLTGHTKPYYEAWVDTTLAAISKCSDEEKEQLIRTFHWPDNDELFYENFKDEQYTGRIKIRQKSNVKP